jgi:hypothetical protein
MSVTDVLDAVRAMSPEDRERVRSLLETLTTELGPQEEARRNLYKAGLLLEEKSRPIVARARRTPVPIKGKSLSETVIEERR